MWEQVRLLAPVPVWSQVALLGREMLVPLAARSKHDMTPFTRSAWPPKATVLRDLRFIRRPITKSPGTISIAERRPGKTLPEWDLRKRAWRNRSPTGPH